MICGAEKVFTGHKHSTYAHHHRVQLGSASHKDTWFNIHSASAIHSITLLCGEKMVPLNTQKKIPFCVCGHGAGEWSRNNVQRYAYERQLSSHNDWHNKWLYTAVFAGQVVHCAEFWSQLEYCKPNNDKSSTEMTWRNGEGMCYRITIYHITTL